MICFYQNLPSEMDAAAADGGLEAVTIAADDAAAAGGNSFGLHCCVNGVKVANELRMLML